MVEQLSLHPDLVGNRAIRESQEARPHLPSPDCECRGCMTRDYHNIPREVRDASREYRGLI